MVDDTARKWLRFFHCVRFCPAMRNQASWASAVADSVWPLSSRRMWPRARRRKSS